MYKYEITTPHYKPNKTFPDFKVVLDGTDAKSLLNRPLSIEEYHHINFSGWQIITNFGLSYEHPPLSAFFTDHSLIDEPVYEFVENDDGILTSWFG